MSVRCFCAGIVIHLEVAEKDPYASLPLNRLASGSF
jgi:hypothetical protein